MLRLYFYIIDGRGTQGRGIQEWARRISNRRDPARAERGKPRRLAFARDNCSLRSECRLYHGYWQRILWIGRYQFLPSEERIRNILYELPNAGQNRGGRKYFRKKWNKGCNKSEVAKLFLLLLVPIWEESSFPLGRASTICRSGEQIESMTVTRRINF